MGSAHPELQKIAELTTKLYLEMVKTGTMKARDSEGNMIDAPLSAAMLGKIMDWMRWHNISLDVQSENNSIANIAARLKEQGVAGTLPPDDTLEETG